MSHGANRRARAWVEAICGSAVKRDAELAGGAGARRYWRVWLADGQTAVLMHAVPEDARILPPALRAETGMPFVEMTRALAARGVPVPALLGVESDERWILLEDLGDVRLCDLEAELFAERLRETIDLLAHVHATPPTAAPLAFSRAFDREWVRFELETFAAHGLPASDAEFARELDTLATCVAELPRCLCLRDVQSQNLMVDASGRLRIIDYQDALAAPPELDLASLLCDSYVHISASERTAMLGRYADRRGEVVDPQVFATLVVQRKCKDYGRYRFVTREKGDSRYMPALARARDAVVEHLDALPQALVPLARRLGDAFSESAS